ncbi:hypothetical protein G6F70_000989 [Rhizopus microsporus]|nr:hypothetical protein G6F71_007516 [Rhizopus microsporus]KAG1203904.1 hypothetical protein G6F70_000989 [Rhizopus microsporus]KAG1208032.1 hypothetical protein G6F69_007562 [Rhizopus microsporus]KAG1229270.1 hypothetical protein G6F67_007268 [Rhizopus microsporus]KAG1261095.1 hypothetical protein G6F68_006944 [Rhizopus microsporus]
MTRFNHAEAINELQELRTTNERCCERVVSLAQRIIDDNYTSTLGDQVWPFYEQAAIAALDTQNFTLANYCIDKLKHRFTEKSLRFRRLLGMRYEAQGLLDEAQEVYDSILKEDETNLLASKRQIALLKARRKDHELMEALTSYLDTYYDDCEAWLELCEVYASKYMYEQAAFCCQEMILLQPSNHIFYLKYAEICYTMNQYEMALKYYCKVLELCTDHVRALYGLHLVSSQKKKRQFITQLILVHNKAAK